MGMNMISKGVQVSLMAIKEHFPHMAIVALSGNYCCDKKSAAVNWIDGRGKSVISMAIINKETVKDVLKVDDIDSLVSASVKKNFKGSALAGTIGGFNSHAANVVTAIFIATGQDPAQSIVSSNCMTEMEKIVADGGDEFLKITCTMPSIEVGTVGGGTSLAAQRACLNMIGGIGGPSKGCHPPGHNSQTLARVICAAVMAGELSLMASLVEGTLVKSHTAFNRSKAVQPK